MKLFLSSRRLYLWLGVIASLTALSVLLGSAEVRLGTNGDFALPWRVLLPVVTGGTCGYFAGTPAEQWELLAVRPIKRPWFSLMILMGVVAASASLVASLSLAGPYSPIVVGRNVMGFSGLSLLAAAFFGRALAWTLPVLWGTAALGAGVYSASVPLWAWPVAPSEKRPALVLAIALLIFGAAAMSNLGSNGVWVRGQVGDE